MRLELLEDQESAWTGKSVCPIQKQSRNSPDIDECYKCRTIEILRTCLRELFVDSEKVDEQSSKASQANSRVLFLGA